MSKIVRVSKGGNTSQSSWYELAVENEAFLGSIPGLGGEDERAGVLIPRVGEPPPGADELADEVLAISGESPSFGRRGSDSVLGVPDGSDMLRTCSRNATSS